MRRDPTVIRKELAALLFAAKKSPYTKEIQDPLRQLAKEAYRNQIITGEEAFDLAACNGWVETARETIPIKHRMLVRDYLAAASVNVVELSRRKNRPMLCAIENGHLAIVKLMMEFIPEEPPESELDRDYWFADGWAGWGNSLREWISEAIDKGQVEIVRYLVTLLRALRVVPGQWMLWIKVAISEHRPDMAEVMVDQLLKLKTLYDRNFGRVVIQKGDVMYLVERAKLQGYDALTTKLTQVLEKYFKA